MQYLKMQDKLDEMDCGQENKINNSQFVPKTEMDYLMLGCFFESQQMTPTQSSPNTQRAYSQYQKQFENHKKKGNNPNSNMMSFGKTSNNGSSTTFSMQFPQNNMTSGQSQYNMQGKIPFQRYNGPNHSNFHNIQNNNNNKMSNMPLVNNNINKQQQQNVPPQNNNLIYMMMEDDDDDIDMDMSSETSSKKDKKKPKRPNKVKPMGCEWCKVTSSPVWRGGPSGKGSLCNACGLQHMKGFTMERAKETLRKNRGEWKINSQM